VVNEDGEEETAGMVVPMLLTIPDAARVLAIGRTTLYELIRDGEVDVIRIGRSTRIPVTTIHAFVDRRRSGQRRATVRVRSPRLVAPRPSE